ncbi:MAG: FAD-binding oxidoreductase [Chloroflexi bacterium]|nr:FAD-binding oxidoreductase [Chloroflexota bacterium]
MAEQQHVVICGAGIIGAATAYFLSRRGVRVTVVERTSVANASSGKAGAFLALDWCMGSPLDALTRRSFALHAELAETLGADWGYQRVTAYSGYAFGRRGMAGGRPGRKWLSNRVALTGQLGSDQTTAMVHPRLLTEALIGAAQVAGGSLRIGQVTGVLLDERGTAARGVTLADGSAIEADAVVIAMGPWSIHASNWLPLPGIHAYKGHSVIYDTGESVPAEALFLEYQTPTGEVLTPEFFPRADGTTYVAYSATQDALPPDPADVTVDNQSIERLEALCEVVSPAFSRDAVVTRQACYRPVAADGLPLVGQVPGVAGAYVGTGHSVWGVLNGPASGEALAELIVDGAARTVNIRAFNPGRLRPYDARLGR